jgi:hypothetical protein
MVYGRNTNAGFPESWLGAEGKVSQWLLRRQLSLANADDISNPRLSQSTRSKPQRTMSIGIAAALDSLQEDRACYVNYWWALP